VPVGTVMSRLARGRERVIRSLEPAGALAAA
jgi:DNA-directed RNA polymerase specialized sigma24 family protein